jgi:hypothetical protein
MELQAWKTVLFVEWIVQSNILMALKAYRKHIMVLFGKVEGLVTLYASLPLALGTCIQNYFLCQVCPRCPNILFPLYLAW